MKSPFEPVAHRQRRPRLRRTPLALMATIALVAGIPGAGALNAALAVPSPCSNDTAPGGDWPAYGRDLANTRTQEHENVITPATAPSLEPAWVFNGGSASEGPRSAFNSTPTVAGNCLFVATGNGAGQGVVFALNADTGTPVWKTKVPLGGPAGVGGGIVGAVAVDGPRLLVLMNKLNTPFAAALDRKTGAVLWTSGPVEDFPGAYTNASPAVFKNILFYGFSTAEGDSQGQGGFALLDTVTGAILKKTYTVPPADQEKGFAGGGLWATPAIDTETKYAYIGSGNPFSKTQEHPHTNAILKIDLDQGRPTFGEIVDSYKGNIDQYHEELEVLSQTPVCIETEELFDGFPLDDPACGQLDLDFGASPNVFKDAQGRTLVGDLQKSGVYHVAETDDMTGAWTELMGASCALCNAASTAYDGTAIYGEGTPGGIMVSLDKSSGDHRWVSPVGDGIHYQSTSTAGGVVYTLDGYGFVLAFDSATGLPLLRRHLLTDAGAAGVGLGSSGVAIARNTVYVASGNGQFQGHVVAYRPGAFP